MILSLLVGSASDFMVEALHMVAHADDIISGKMEAHVHHIGDKIDHEHAVIETVALILSVHPASDSDQLIHSTPQLTFDHFKLMSPDDTELFFEAVYSSSFTGERTVLSYEISDVEGPPPEQHA